MAAPGFGFSFGDFIAGVNLVRGLIRALNDSAGARASYRKLISELLNLDTALTSVSNLEIDPAQIAQKIALEQAASQCQLSITTFLNKNAKFESSLGIVSGGPNSTSKWQASLHKIQWALCRDGAIQALRAEIQAHTITVNYHISIIQIASANQQKQTVDSCMNIAQRTQVETGETVALAKQNHQLLTFQAGQISSISSTVAMLLDQHEEAATVEIDLRTLARSVMESNAKIFATVLQTQQLLLSTLPAQVEFQQPVVFEDALGRLAPLHLEWVSSLAAFQAGLEARFQDKPGLNKVKTLEYALQDVASRRKIDLKQPWDSFFRPGRRVNMSMVFPQTQAQTSSCPGCFSENVVVGDDTNDEIQCSNSMCGMWYRRITELDDPSSTVEGKPQDVGGTEEQDAIHEFRRVQIVHRQAVATNDIEQGLRFTRRREAYATSSSSSGATWFTASEAWSTQQPVQSADSPKTKLNNKGQYVTVINHKQQNRQYEPSPTYRPRSTYGKQA